MANWLYDAKTSAATGHARFRLPYPGGDWSEEKKKNEYFLFLMEEARATAIVGHKVKKGKKLTDRENKLLEQIAEAL
ncbi:MAG: hypothetical protein DRI46_08360 [Chloroflexi bacterium]|nr:MAG: hypothetical protein DRI46_08360 [Chloroflexota bacterium]